MIKGHGIDIVDVKRIKHLLDKYGITFARKYFSPEEVAGAEPLSCSAAYYAARFAAKEAFAKAVGTGFSGFGLSDVWVAKSGAGLPSIRFSAKVIEKLPSIAEGGFVLSLSHEKQFAIASVIWFQKK